MEIVRATGILHAVHISEVFIMLVSASLHSNSGQKRVGIV